MTSGTPRILRAHDLAAFAGRTVLVITPHADDTALFCGGTVALMARAGAHVVLLRVTRDDTDSVGWDAGTTERRIDAELEVAAHALGISEVHGLGYDSDRLSDVPLTDLRERMIRAFRTFRPYAVLTFDPYSAYGEDNSDHVRTAQAVDESFWTAMFDKHHPGHQDEGLEPHGVVERWYFGRRVTDVTDVVDVADTLAAKTDAAIAHRTMLGHLVHQLRLMARTAGRDIGDVDDLVDDPSELVRLLVPAGAARVGERYGLSAAEEFRVVRYSGLSDVILWLEERAGRQRGEEI